MVYIAKSQIMCQRKEMKRGGEEKEVEKDKMSTNRREGMRRTQIQYKNVYTFLCGVAVW
jgi:hypothetical protein